MDAYVSAFRIMNHDDPGDACPSDTLCMSMGHGIPLRAEWAWDGEHVSPQQLCWQQVTEAAVLLSEHGLPQPAFFFFRLSVELGLKALGGHQLVGHDLGSLVATGLNSIPPECHQWCRDLVADLIKIDPRGDQGRYATTATTNDVSLAGVCCASKERMLDNLETWIEIVDANVSWPSLNDFEIEDGIAARWSSRTT